MYIHLHERFRGALVGVHVGDAIGAPYETWGPKKIAADIEAREGLKFFDYENPWKHEKGPSILPAGRPTDDSDQAADLAWSLIECDGLDQAHLREALRNSVVLHRSRLWDGTALGAGGTTKKALSDNPEKISEALNNNIGTNGSLMRSVPMALWLHGKMRHARVWNNAEKIHWAPEVLVAHMSEVTHNHPHSRDACWFYCIMMEAILSDVSKDKLLDHIEYIDEDFLCNKFSSRIQYALEDEFLFPVDPGRGQCGAPLSFHSMLRYGVSCTQHRLKTVSRKLCELVATLIRMLPSLVDYSGPITATMRFRLNGDGQFLGTT